MATGARHGCSKLFLEGQGTKKPMMSDTLEQDVIPIIRLGFALAHG